MGFLDERKIGGRSNLSKIQYHGSNSIPNPSLDVSVGAGAGGTGMNASSANASRRLEDQSKDRISIISNTAELEHPRGGPRRFVLHAVRAQ